MTSSSDIRRHVTPRGPVSDDEIGENMDEILQVRSTRY